MLRPAPAALLLCALACPAAGQDRNTLYVNPAPLVTSARLLGLAGASVGLAENSESIPFNYATVAHRTPKRARGFDFDLNASVLFSPFPGMRDVDNETTPAETIAPIDSQFGGLIQFKRFGIGVSGRLARRDVCVVQPCGPNEKLSGSASQWAVVFGFNVWRDQLVFGAGLYIAAASFEFGGRAFSYRGYNLGGGVLFRPAFLPFRIGLHGVSETNGVPVDFDLATTPAIQGRPVFEKVVSPAHISLGASARFGAGNWRFNRLSGSAMKELPEDFNAADVPHDLDPDDPRPPGRVLISFQLDLVFPVKNATTLSPFLDPNLPRLGIGERFSVVPRLGSEVEAIDHRLRLRLGGYLEPAFLEGASLRPHLTFGTELFLFTLLMDWSVSVSMDVSARYLSMSFGIGWWS